MTSPSHSPRSAAPIPTPTSGGGGGEALTRAAASFRRRVGRARLLGAALHDGAWAALAAGALVLVLRTVGGTPAGTAAWAFLLVPLAFALAARRAHARALSPAGAAAWLDVRSGGGGALVTAAERGDVRWEAEVRAALARVEAPRLRLGRRPLALLGALAFGLVALVVPIPEGVVGRDPLAALVERDLDELAEELATLEEEVTLEEVVARELEERLETLRDEVAASDHEGALEATDRLRERLSDEAQRARESALAASEALARGARDARGGATDAAAEGLTRGLEELQAAGLEALAREALADALEQAGDSPLAEALDAVAAGRRAELEGEGAEALASLAEALAKAGLAGAAAEAASALDPETLRALAELLAEDPELARALAEAAAAALGDKLARLADAGLLEDAALLSKDQLRSLSELLEEVEPHTCDASCPPGGT